MWKMIEGFQNIAHQSTFNNNLQYLSNISIFIVGGGGGHNQKALGGWGSPNAF